MKTFIFIFLILFPAFWEGCSSKVSSGLPYFNDPDFTPIWIKVQDPNFKNIHTLPKFSLIDQNRKGVNEKTIEGKIVLANFFFTRCGNICPIMMDNMKKAGKVFEMDTNIIIISHSVTPVMDNPEVLYKYAKNKGIHQSNWHLVTGNRDSIYFLARKGYFADNVTGAEINNQFLHTENFILVDKQKHIRGVYNGTLELEVNNMIRQAKLLEKEE